LLNHILDVILFVFQAVTFKKTSRTLARSLWWKNVKLTIVIIVVVIVSTGLINIESFFFWMKVIA